MSDIEKDKQRVRAFLASGAVSKRKLALASGLWPSNLTLVEWARWSPEPRTLAKLIRAIERFERDQVKKKSRRSAASGVAA